jgi:hypothetical protein
MKIKSGFMLREIANNFIVVPVGKAAVDFNGIITLNETGSFLWKEMIQETTMAILLKQLISTYQVSEEIAKQDLLQFIDVLKKAELLE